MHDRLVRALRAKRPEALDAAEELLRSEDSRRGESAAVIQGGLKQLVAPAASPAPFSFNFM